MEYRMTCPKCECEIAEKQKVCPRCGANTPASFLYYDDKKGFKLSKTHKIIAAGIVLLIIMTIIIGANKTSSPDQVALKWVSLMTQRAGGDAKEYESPKFEGNLLNKWPDRLSLSDEYYSQISSGNVVYKVEKPIYLNPTTATVQVTAKDSVNSTLMLQITLVKAGKRWLVEDSN